MVILSFAHSGTKLGAILVRGHQKRFSTHYRLFRISLKSLQLSHVVKVFRDEVLVRHRECDDLSIGIAHQTRIAMRLRRFLDTPNIVFKSDFHVNDASYRTGYCPACYNASVMTSALAAGVQTTSPLQ